MDWQDTGLLLSVRPHGESSAIIEVLTSAHGRHAGLVRGGASRKLAATLQPGAQLALEWQARLEEHLGHFRAEPVRSRAGGIMADRATLAAFNAVAAMVLTLLPEREPHSEFYAATVTLADALEAQLRDWPGAYAVWEVGLLEALGFGLDLGRCAVTGMRHDLFYVSPRTGRAVSRDAGAPWADKLLPLPAFLIGQGAPTPGAVREAIRMTGWFFLNRACPAMEREGLPEARERLVRALDRLEPAEASPGARDAGGPE
jgi:DNA repair protein RecO (recombination protein O)